MVGAVFGVLLFEGRVSEGVYCLVEIVLASGGGSGLSFSLGFLRFVRKKTTFPSHAFCVSAPSCLICCTVIQETHCTNVSLGFVRVCVDCFEAGCGPAVCGRPGGLPLWLHGDASGLALATALAGCCLDIMSNGRFLELDSKSRGDYHFHRFLIRS